MTGKKRTNSRKRKKNRPNVPARKIGSVTGTKYSQLDTSASRCSDVTVMTKRSNHMPMFTKNAMTNDAPTLVRIFLNQNSCGMPTLQLTIVQYAHAYGPKARLMNVKPSYSLPE